MARLLLSKTSRRKKCQGRDRHKFRPEKNFKHPSDSRKLSQESVNRLRPLRCFAVALHYALLKVSQAFNLNGADPLPRAEISPKFHYILCVSTITFSS